MDYIERSELSKSEKIQVLELWNREYPQKLNYETLTDFENYLISLSGRSHIIMMDKNGRCQAWYFDFTRDNERWFALIIDSTLHGKGYGTKMLNLAKTKEEELSGWVIDHSNDKKRNGEFYISPLVFYLKNDFKELPKERLESDSISAVKIKWKR